MASKGTLRICDKGHKYYKSSDGPVCPVCEGLKTPEAEFLASLASLARRALENAGVKTVSQLSTYSEHPLLSFHGMGQGSIPKLRKALKDHGLSFRK